MAELKEKRTDAIQGEIIHIYDGIEEADNELPTWWLWTFYGAIVFAVFYWFAYHELEALPLPAQRYAMDLAERSSGGEVSEELLLAMVSDPAAVASGGELYQEHCAVCHKEQGEGNIGPNLTDVYWLHGGSPTNIHATISEGVLQNGMPAWGQTLGADSVQKVTAFVLSIRDSNVPGKEPQGEEWVPGGGDDADEETTEEETTEEEASAEPEVETDEADEAVEDEEETVEEPAEPAEEQTEAALVGDGVEAYDV